MSTGVQYGDLVTRTVTMDSDLSEKTYYAVNLDTTDEENVNLAAAATAFPFPLVDGVDGSSAKAVGAIALSGRCKVIAGGVVAPGDKLTSDGDGKWITTTTDNDHFGAVALEIGAAGDIIEVLVVQGQVSL
jgi:hypothetical protein